MLSQKGRDFQPHLVSLETLIPPENFYRKLEDKLDLIFVRDLVKPFYQPFGRPSIDPVVFFKLQLIMFLLNATSSRRRCGWPSPASMTMSPARCITSRCR
jgi:transposase